MKKNLISVIIPAYNVEKYIEKCVLSVLNQTYSNLEVIIVNDGSTDRTLDLCLKLSGGDGRIRIINQSNRGLSCARNAGLDASNGEWIAFLDSDDWVEPEMYQTLIEIAVKNDCAIASCDSLDVVDGLINRATDDNDVSIYDLSSIVFGLYEKKHIRFEVWNKLWNRELISNVRFIDGQISEDVFFDTELFLKAKKMVHINRTLHNYRVFRPGNTNSTFKMKRVETFKEFKRFSLKLRDDGFLQASECMDFILLRYILTVYNEALVKKIRGEDIKRILSMFVEYYDQSNKKSSYNRWSYRILRFCPSIYNFFKRRIQR